MTPTDLAAAYFTAWPARDADQLRAVLADDVDFAGPLGTADGADACVEGLLGMARTMERVDVRLRLASENDVMTWFDLRTTQADPMPVVNWMHVRDGRIARIRVAFDPRPLLGG